MRSFEELLEESSTIHGHHCAGQVLGVRLAMAGCREVDIDEPKGCKKLIVYVEIDRCATDAIQAVTGCSLGKRTLKFLDYGKMAATFVNTETGKAARVLARDDARSLAPHYAPETASPREAQKKAYAVMPEELLFSIQPAKMGISEADMPGFRGPRVFCDACGEGINLRREVRLAGRTLCMPCSQNIEPSRSNRMPGTQDGPKALLIVGFKKVGKTTLIERLVVELSNRGYRVGTVKHHHSESLLELDAAGTDTWRHRKAGAKTVALMTPTQAALFRDAAENESLEETLAQFGANDIVLVEGFHDEPRYKIEVLASGGAGRLCAGDKNLIATVGNGEGRETIPSFAPNQIVPLADFIESEILERISPPGPIRARQGQNPRPTPIQKIAVSR